MPGPAPLQDREAEAALLGALLSGSVNGDVIGQVVTTVRGEEDFAAEAHRLIFQAIAALHTAGEPVDAVTVKEGMQRAGTLVRLRGGALYLHDLLESCPNPAAVLAYAEQVRRGARRVAMLQALQIAQEKITRGGDPDAVMAGLPREIDHTPWAAVDLGPVLAGEIVDEPPSTLTRTDDRALLYQGKMHAVAGEPETGKSWLALAACVEEIAEDRHALYVDFEDSEVTAVARLRALGVPVEAILERFHYIRAEGPPPPDITAVLPEDATLAVLDGVTEAMHLMGLSLKDNDDVATFLGRLARPLVSQGVTVLLLDHVVKDREARGRGAIGAQHKLAGVDVAYALEIVTPFGRGLEGHSRLTITKDRPGFVRAASAGRRYAADLRLHSEGEDVAVVLEPVEMPQPDPLGLAPAERRVLDALPVGPPGEFPREIGDRVADWGRAQGLRRETISRALGRLRGLQVADGAQGRWWRIGPPESG